jgi:hypothetical protein
MRRTFRCGTRSISDGKDGQIATGAKAATLAGEDYRAKLDVASEAFSHGNQLSEHGIVNRVEFLGSIEPHFENLAVLDDENASVVGLGHIRVCDGGAVTG